jgi:hypothetical protein
MALGSSAPACQVAKPHVWDMLHKVVGGTLLSAADMAALAGRVPSLWNFIRSHALTAAGYPAAVKALVKIKMTDGKVDALHYKEHTRCAPDYDSGLYKEIDNSQLAEQKNAALRRLGNAVFYMHQHTFLTFGLHWLHRMHCIEKMKAAGECWWA